MTEDRTSRRAAWWLAGAAAVALASGALAAPPPLPPPPSSGAILQQVKPVAPPLTAPEAPLILEEPARQASQSKVPIAVGRFVIDGAHLLPTERLLALVQPAVGKTLTLGEIQAYVARITDAYHRAGYPLAYAYLPPQTVDGGTVRIAVVEPRYDKVSVVGASRLSQRQILATMGVASGDTVASASLNRGLLLLNQTPGVRVQGELIPGADPGTSTLQLKPQDLPFWAFQVGESNYGSPYTGAFLTTAALTANDPFGEGSSIAVNGVRSQSGNLLSGGFAATSPNLWNGLRLGAYGSTTGYRLAGVFAPLEETGHSGVIGADLTYPLILEPGTQVLIRLDVLDNGLSQTTESTGRYARQTIPIERGTLSYVLADTLGGVTTGSLLVEHGYLRIGFAEAAALDAAGPKAAGSFLLGQLQVDRQQSLPAGFRVDLGISEQVSGKNLDGSQKFYLGGPMGVMSYPVGEAGGDTGYLANFKLAHAVPLKGLIPGGALDLSLMGQQGRVQVNKTLYSGFDAPNTLSEAGAGPGLDFAWKGLTISAAYEHRLGPNSAPATNHQKGRAWFQAGYNF